MSWIKNLLANHKVNMAAIGLVGLAVYQFSIGQTELAITALLGALAALGGKLLPPAPPEPPKP